MPELPEVETVRRALDARCRGKTVAAVVVRRPTFYRRPPAAALRALAGATIRGFSRRGQYLIAELEQRLGSPHDASIVAQLSRNDPGVNCQ